METHRIGILTRVSQWGESVYPHYPSRLIAKDVRMHWRRYVPTSICHVHRQYSGEMQGKQQRPVRVFSLVLADGILVETVHP